MEAVVAHPSLMFFGKIGFEQHIPMMQLRSVIELFFFTFCSSGLQVL